MSVSTMYILVMMVVSLALVLGEILHAGGLDRHALQVRGQKKLCRQQWRICRIRRSGIPYLLIFIATSKTLKVLHFTMSVIKRMVGHGTNGFKSLLHIYIESFQEFFIAHFLLSILYMTVFTHTWYH